MSAVEIAAGERVLEAEAELRPGAPLAIVCHPHPAFGGRMDTPLVVALAGALADAGLSTVRFQFRGVGASTGTPTGGLHEHEDVRAVAAWARSHGASKIALVGYSFGALMALRAIAAGEPAGAYAAVALPTTIIGDREDRIADVHRALSTGTPSYFIHGDRDQFVEIDRIATWTRDRPHARVDLLDGRGHFFAPPDDALVCARVAAFVSAALAASG